MKIMKKLLLLLTAAAALLFTACNKDKEQDQTPAESSFEFKIEQTNFNFKNDVPECSELDMNYVKFIIDGTTFTSEIYYVDGEMLTEVIKLPVGEYTMTSFLVYNDSGTPGMETDDVLIKAAPEPNSEYWDLMENKLDLDFSVTAFYKKQISIDVLCFEELFYEHFGFTWFQFNDIKIERLCFFGDICTGKLQDFMDTELMDSPYEEQLYGVQMDMPAIFQIEVFKTVTVDNVETLELIKIFDNMSYINENDEEIFYYGEGRCLEVYWPNHLDEIEEFTFVLNVMLPSGPIFEYRHINTWTFQDEQGVAAGDDGIVDFVMGSCSYQDADYNFPFWMNLPLDPFTLVIGPVAPGVYGTWADITLSGISDGK